MPTPAAALSTKSPAAPARENDPLTAAATANLYAMRPVESLMRLSPSTIVTSRRGARERTAISTAATGSVGETIAPSTNAAVQGMPSTTAWTTTATATVVAITSPTVSVLIGRQL